MSEKKKFAYFLVLNEFALIKSYLMKITLKRIFLLILLTSFIALSNYYSYVYIFLADGVISNRYKFETFDGKHQFITMPEKGTDLKTMERRFASFCEKNPHYKNTDLYRTFGRNPLKYWRWYEFVSHPRYQYKFKKPSKISFDHFTMRSVQKIKKEGVFIYYRNESELVPISIVDSVSLEYINTLNILSFKEFMVIDSEKRKKLIKAQEKSRVLTIYNSNDLFDILLVKEITSDKFIIMKGKYQDFID